MNIVSLKFPVLVQMRKNEADKKPVYILKPLFGEGPQVEHRLYERALSRFRQEVRSFFNRFELDRTSLDSLAWFTFQPDVRFRVVHLNFVIFKQNVTGRFAVADFTIGDNHFLLLPDFNHHLMMLSKENDWSKQKFIDEAAQREIERIFRAVKAETDNRLEVIDYEANAQDFITTFTCDVKISPQPFAFEKDDEHSPFAFFNTQQNFDGETEINKVGYDLLDRYPGELLRAHYRELEVGIIKKKLTQKKCIPTAIIGKEGIGRHSILHEAIYQFYAEHELLNALEHLPKVWHIDPTRIISGMSIVGMWQKRFETMLDFAIKRNKNLKKKDKHYKPDTIVIDNVIAMLRVGKSSQNDMTLCDVLRPYLEERKLGFFVIATPEQWQFVQDKDRRFADIFQVLQLEEPDTETALKMVLRQRRLLELRFDCEFSLASIKELFDTHRVYLRQKALPGGVMQFMAQLANKHQNEEITPNEVVKIFEEYSGFNANIFDETQTLNHEQLKTQVSSQLIGQQRAVEVLLDIIHTVKSKMNKPKRPFATCLFAGPTGVGKTQAAKVLCKVLMDNENHLLRFDMNEYIDALAVHRLIGDAHKPDGHLTSRVRLQPFGIILFDEIEKAHQSVHDMLLQVLDEGRLTDAMGRTVDFSNTVIIMTSNLGATQASSFIGFANENIEANRSELIYQRAIENHFRLEFINRIQYIVTFEPLYLDHIKAIAKLQLNEFLNRDGFVRRTTILDIEEPAIEWVVKRGFDARMGGRSLKRQIERDLTALSAKELVSIKNENPIIFKISLDNHHLAFDVLVLSFEEAQIELKDILPPINKYTDFYKEQLYRLEDIEDALFDDNNNDDESEVKPLRFDDETPNPQLDWQYWWLKEFILQTKEIINNKILGLHTLPKNNTNTLRFKRIVKMQEKQSGNDNSNTSTTKEYADLLLESSRSATSEFSPSHAEAVNHFVQVSILENFVTDFLETENEQIYINIQSLVTGKGDTQCKHLLQLYENILDDFNIQYEKTEHNFSISLESKVAYTLFQKEEGCHLFYVPQQTPIVLLVSITKNNSVSSNIQSKTSASKIIRLYFEGQYMADLRTGLITDYTPTLAEMKCLLYAATLNKHHTQLDEN